MVDKQPEVDIEPLNWTGERIVPGVGGRVEVEHLHRYALARRLAHGKDVLDIACGEGYGTHLLAGEARFAAGVDISGQVVALASRKYVATNIEFRCGSCSAIPYPDHSFDLVVSFETIEHHDQHEQMMQEIRRVLRSEGRLLISSPDRLFYSELPGYANPFHVKELYKNEFSQLLRAYFCHVAIYGQKICFGSLIAPIEPQITTSGFAFAGGDAACISEMDNLFDSTYLIALASQENLPAMAPGFWDATCTLVDEALLAEQQTRIDKQPPLLNDRPFGHYRLGDEVDFRLGGNALLFQRNGWDIPTVGGAWTIGPEAALHFRMVDWQCGLTPLWIEIEAQGVLAECNPETQMELRINDHLVCTDAFREAKIQCWSYAVPPGTLPTTELHVDIRILNPSSPKALGLSEDERKLGLLFTRLRITQA